MGKSVYNPSDSNGYGVKRLSSKDARSAIIQKLASDFNLTAIIAEAYYQQFSQSSRSSSWSLPWIKTSTTSTTVNWFGWRCRFRNILKKANP